MTGFLEHTARYLFERHGEELGEVCVVLPSRRAGLFLKKHLGQLARRPVFSPVIYSIEDFVFSLSDYRKAETAYLLFEFYEVYRTMEGVEASPFREFVKWGEVVLQDFNEVDLYLVDPAALFGYLSDAKAIALWNPDQQPLTPFEARYLRFFNSLAALYRELTGVLREKKVAYQGMAYREVAGKLAAGEAGLPWRHILFAGFNALTTSEEKIIGALLEKGMATLRWDADTYYLEDPMQEAGAFLRKNRRIFRADAMEWTQSHFAEGEKTIHLVGVPGSVGQAKAAGEILADIQRYNPQLDNCSIVLNDGNLLFPVLSSLPAGVDAFNLTMGLPLRKTVLHGLVEAFIQLNENALRFSRSADRALRFYYRDLLRIAEHPYFPRLLPEAIAEGDMLAGRLRTGNQVFFSQHQIAALFPDPRDRSVAVLFEPWGDDAGKAISGILALLRLLKTRFGEGKPETDRINIEYVFHFSLLFNKLRSYQEEYSFLNDLESFRHMFQQLVRSLSIPFYGEPLRGVQVMGMLETRTLDFEHVVMLSVNEDFIPGKGITNSFIPVDIKRQFQLPTHRERNAVSAYHFYRLLQRARNIHLLYNTEPGELGGGDRSRFIAQLEYELTRYNPGIRINSRVLSLLPSGAMAGDEVAIPKSEEVMVRIRELAMRGFSASGLNALRNCSLRFYFRYVLGIAESDEVEETMEASTLGNVVHHALQHLYEPRRGRVLRKEDYAEMLSGVEGALQRAFHEKYPGGDTGSGKNLLMVKVAESYVRRFLRNEKEASGDGGDLVVRELELPLETELPGRNPGSPGVRMRGVIDRVDHTGGQLRIIDYKTGKTEAADLRLKDWADLLIPGKLDKLFQLLFYVNLYLGDGSAPAGELTAGIYSFRNLGAGLVTPALPGKVSAADAMPAFRELLGDMLSELFDTTIPFRQVEDEKVCTYCPYRSICNRVAVRGF